VTYGSNPKYLCPFTVFRSPAEAGESSAARAGCSQVNSSQAVLRCEFPGVGPLLSVAPGVGHHPPNHFHHHQHHRPRSSEQHRPPVSGLFARSAAVGGAAAVVLAASAADLLEENMSSSSAKRSSLSSEGEAVSDEGVEEAPSQSEGEGGGGSVGIDGAMSDNKYSNTASPHHHLLKSAAASFRSNGSEEEGSGGGSGKGAEGKREAESSPERDLESDWSSGQSETAAGRPLAEHPPSALAQAPSLPPVAAAAQAELQDYRVYFYDPKIPLSSANEDGTKEEVDIFRNLRRIDDPWEILFMRAEGIHAHGYQSHACDMAVRLAMDMLKNPPDLISDAPPLTTTFTAKGKRRRVGAASHQITHTASTTLTHCAFLCTVLSETAQGAFHLNLAFQIGMFGLEMARPPASTKPMEVKLAHQESELVSLLKRLPLGPAELAIVRERALQLKEGTLKTRGEALLPLMLASFIFESLVLPRSSSGYAVGRNGGCDEQLGFEAAVAAIGLKAGLACYKKKF
jgi:hypothetical protein